jgi:hypothetical protein
MGNNDSKKRNSSIFFSNLDDNITQTTTRKNNSSQSNISLERRQSKSLSDINLEVLNLIRNRNKTNLYKSFQFENKNMVLAPKTNQIYDDYVISKTVLGLGISGKVLCCTSKTTKKKYALKVNFQVIFVKTNIFIYFH